MKYYFIMNPVTGSSDKTKILTEEVKKAFLGNFVDQYEIYITKCHGDAEQYVKEQSKNLQEDVVFFACGGDGTTYEVLNGIEDFEHASLGVISVGSCNDFLKNFPGCDFRSIEKAIKGTTLKVDLLRCNHRYCLNEVNMGFDAMVNDDCNRIKSHTKKVKTAYTRAILKNIILKRTPKAEVLANDCHLYNGKLLLMTFSNGKYYGGGYCSAPKAIVNDGLMEVLVVKNLSRFRFITMIKDYKKGTHLDKKRFVKLICYTRGTTAKVKFEKQTCICLDGEITYSTEATIRIIPSKLNFIIPGE